MEGTRHEKVILVTSAYVIGFVTGFIAFGINNAANTPLVMTNYIPTASAPAEEKVVEASLEVTDIGFDDDGLYATVGEEKVLLSAKKTAFAASIISSGEVDGFHYDIVDAHIAPNKQHAYFCEQLSENATGCTPYIYAVQDGALHSVTFADERITLPLTGNQIMWSDDGLLFINGMITSDSAMPWLLGGNDETVTSESAETSVETVALEAQAE